MVVGVNGVGKTTSIGKIAAKFVRSGRSVLLVAGDTFRAAAIDQLKIWADRTGVEVVSQKAEYAARTIRPKIRRHLDDFLIPLKPVKVKKDSLGLISDRL